MQMICQIQIKRNGWQLLFAITMFYNLPVSGQMQYGLNRDSLRQVIAESGEDSTKVNTLIALGQQLENETPDAAITLYREAGRLSETLHYLPGIIRYISNYTAVLNVQGKFDESLRLNLKAVELSSKNGLKPELAKALINTAVVYQYKESFQEAIDYYLKALPLITEAKNPQHLSVVYSNLCGLYRNLNQYEKSLYYATMAYHIANKSGDTFALTSASLSRGNALKSLGRVKEGLIYLNKAYHLSRKLNDRNFEGTVLINIGDSYLQLRNVEKSLDAYRRALPIARSINDVSGTAFALEGIAICMFRNRQFAAAEPFTSDGIAYARTHDQKEVLSSLLLLMSDIKIALGQLDRSQDYRAQYDSVSNSILNSGLLKNVQELEARYETEKRKRELIEKNRQLEQRTLESRRQKQWLIVLVTSFFISCIVALLIYRLYLQKQKLNVQEQTRIRLSSRLDGERQERRRISQEIHDDMGAGLTRMLFLSRAVQAGSISEKLINTSEELIKKMNEVIWMMNDGQDTLSSLIAYLRRTVTELLDQASISYRFETPEPFTDISLSRELRRNVYLAVKEAVHNVVKHARATEVQIHILQSDKLQITVQDNGRGLNEMTDIPGNGIRNMRQRTEQIGGFIDVKVHNGTMVTFKFPLQ